MDKMEFLRRLLEPAGRSFFLSRPRRFGKPLIVSTIRVVFEGEEGAVQGVGDLRQTLRLEAVPRRHLDRNGWEFSSAEEQENRLRDAVTDVAAPPSPDFGTIERSSQVSEMDPWIFGGDPTSFPNG